MVDILVRPVELRQIAEQLRASSKKVGTALQAIDNDILALKGDRFLGNRANAVQAHYAPKREALLKAKEIVAKFAGDLQVAADVFEKADSQGFEVGANLVLPFKPKTRIYLVNGINYNNDPDSKDPEGDMKKLKENIEAQYGKDVEVIIVTEHPYDSNPKYDPKGIDLIGVAQVEHEYITGGSEQSNKVNKFIQDDLDDLKKNGLLGSGVDVVLVGHSGGGAIVANISDEIENLDGVNVKGMVTMGSPISNFDHASKYADKIVDIMADDDNVGKIGGLGTIRSEEMRWAQGDLLKGASGVGAEAVVGAIAVFGTIDKFFRNSYSNVEYVHSGTGGHGSYWESNQVAKIIGDLASSDGSGQSGGASW